MSKRFRIRLLWLLVPISAIVLAFAVSSIALLAIGESPITSFRAMFEYGSQQNSLVSTVNRAVPLYMAGLAVAIGFKMNLFNIGVEGQYRIAVLLSAAAGAAVTLPAPLHIAFIMLVAMAAGAAWAGIAGVLKVKRGVHEVVSTIMLNYIATGIGAYLLANYLRKPRLPNELIIQTRPIPPSGQLPPLAVIGGENLRSFVLIAAVLGFLVYVLIWRTRFGYDLRASGINPDAARTSGVDPNRMILTTMLISGAVAGLIGMSDLFGFFHAYTLDFPTGLGFDGIAVALVGLNHPVGIAVAAMVFGWVDRAAQILDLEGVPKEVIIITKGVIILSVVIAYEVVRRLVQAQEVKAAAEETRKLEEQKEAAAA
ncbi:MAG TPA: ABC transporter permease [Acidimicrobiia bacterium]